MYIKIKKKYVFIVFHCDQYYYLYVYSSVQRGKKLYHTQIRDDFENRKVINTVV